MNSSFKRSQLINKQKVQKDIHLIPFLTLLRDLLSLKVKGECF
jgi:hypothetical protein